jgi:CDP-4-dehydro-6-deoxyglucose reductase, E3
VLLASPETQNVPGATPFFLKYKDKTTMVMIKFRDESWELSENESVLDGMLRHGHPVPNSCRAGACQVCMLRVVSGTVPAKAQQGLKTTLVHKGAFLSCTCYPESDLEIDLADQVSAWFDTTILEQEQLNADVLRVRLQKPEGYSYQAGQFCHVQRSDGLTRSYSLASVPEHEPWLELHLRVLPEGQLTGWFAHQAKLGDTVRISEPNGNCFYLPGNPDQPILLAGVGTGLAPLWGILRAALRANHRGPLFLFHGSTAYKRLYYQSQIRELVEKYSHIKYIPCALQAPEDQPTDLVVGPIDQAVKLHCPSTKGMRAYLCGDPDLVKVLQKKVFLAGAAHKEIFADPFVTAPVTAT